MQELKGLAMGIGSLPHKDADSAINLIFKYLPEIPFWPQLPKRDIREGMIAQFSENFPFLKVDKDGLNFSMLDAKDKELEAFYEKIIANDIDHFKISQEYALGLHKFYQRLENLGPLGDTKFIKCQVTGPFTFASSIKDDLGNPLLHDEVLLQVVLKGLIMKANWQINMFRKFGKKMIMFFDEPYLSSFGSAYTPVNREDVVRVLSELTEAVKSPDVLLGVHCCGNTDWSIFMDVPKIDIISFDAFDFLDRLVLYSDNLKDFLGRGGILCWGIVPTQLFTGEETAELLIRKIRDGIFRLKDRGLEENLLLENMLLSSSCGLGTFTPEKSEKVFKLLAEVSSLMRKYG
ncbi:MAG: methionine synthase [Candidatus Omnitrophota bacterium]